MNIYFSHCVLLLFGIFSNVKYGVYSLTEHELHKPGPNAYHQKHILGPERNYSLEWTVIWSSKSIIFNISAECKGYIGMGLSKTGSIAGSDFVIGGIDSGGHPYFSDMHGVANETLQHDQKRDWKLLDAHRQKGRINLSFSRPFETCDDKDYQISVRQQTHLVHVIWAYGDTDEVTLFSPHHGTETFYLLDPDLTTRTANSVYREIGPHSNLYLMQRWRAMTKQKLSSNFNSQMCSIIKGPKLAFRHYILGGGVYLPVADSKFHIRQVILSHCLPPEGREAAPFFDPLAKREGQDCNSFQNSSLIPKHLCTETVFIWGVGGKPFYFPEEVGIPIGTSVHEYYLLEIHYINPQNLDNVTVKGGLDLMFHPRPRPYEAGILTVSHGLYGLFAIPPRSAAFSVYGHCSSQCTSDILPNKDSIVFAVLLQMRALGKSVRLRHFRGVTELPWILSDDNYDSDYQKIRLLPKPVDLLPGDHITIQCTYDSSSIPNTTLSGSSSDQEMCVAYLFVNQRVSSAWCSSENAIENQLQHFGMQVPTRNLLSQRRENVDKVSSGSTPSQGQQLINFSSKSNQWTPSARAALQREMLHGLQKSSCPSLNQVAKSGRLRKLPSVSNRSKTGQTNTTMPVASLATPLASGFVTIPVTSLEYRPTSECKWHSISAKNLGYHRNVLAEKLNSASPTPTFDSVSTNGNKQHLIPKLASTDKFRRTTG